MRFGVPGTAIRRAALAEEVRAELDAQERLVWVGYPDAGATLRKLRPLMWLGGVCTVIAGAVAWFHAAGQVGLLIGGALAAGPFVNSWRAANTVYALSDRRAIVICKLAGSIDRVSVDLGCADREPEILRLQGKTGTVLFVSGLPPRRRYTDHTGKFGFWDVPDVDEVAAILRQIGDRARSPPRGPGVRRDA